MSAFSRRQSLAVAASGLLASLTACSSATTRTTVSETTFTPKVALPVTPPAPRLVAGAAIGSRPLSYLPADSGRKIALTIDDGVSTDDVRAYATLCKETGMRLTFFANGVYDSWREVKPILAPLIESGQVVIGNHTWNHPDLRTCSMAKIRWQMQTNEAHFHNLYGISTLKPFMRPPYGYWDTHVKQALEQLGYHAMVLWMGTLGDDQDIAPATIMQNAREWVQPGRIVIGHANHPGTAHVVDQIHALVEQRRLQTVTVADVWGSHLLAGAGGQGQPEKQPAD